MFIARERCRLIVFEQMPTAVLLSQWMGVGGLGWPISSKVSRIIFAFIALRKNAPSSASAAEAATHLRMVQLVRMTPLRRMGHPRLWGGSRGRIDQMRGYGLLVQ